MVFGKGNEAWRSHPLISNNHRHAFPGFKNAAIIFGVYCAVEYAYKAANAPPPKIIRVDDLKFEKEVGQRVTVERTGSHSPDSHHQGRIIEELKFGRTVGQRVTVERTKSYESHH